MMEHHHQEADSAHPVLVAVETIPGRARAKAAAEADEGFDQDEIDGKLIDAAMEKVRKSIAGVLRMWGAGSGANVSVAVYLEKPR